MVMEKETAVIEGRQIVRLYTLGSKYDSGKFIEAEVLNEKGEEETMRIDVNNLLPILKRYKFDANPKRQYRHLTVRRKKRG
jgi:hypothetical protein